MERSLAWTTRFRRLVRDYERLPATLAGLHLVVFACLMLHHWMAFSGPTSRHVQEQETPVRRQFREHPIDLFYLQFNITTLALGDEDVRN